MIGSTRKQRRHQPIDEPNLNIQDTIQLVKSLNPLKHNSKIALLKHNLGLLSSSTTQSSLNDDNLEDQIMELQTEIKNLVESYENKLKA